jgi:hypothetical protein
VETRAHSLLGRLAAVSQPGPPLLHVRAAPFWARVLVAGGAQRATREHGPDPGMRGVQSPMTELPTTSQPALIVTYRYMLEKRLEVPQLGFRDRPELGSFALPPGLPKAIAYYREPGPLDAAAGIGHALALTLAVSGTDGLSFAAYMAIDVRGWLDRSLFRGEAPTAGEISEVLDALKNLAVIEDGSVWPRTATQALHDMSIALRSLQNLPPRAAAMIEGALRAIDAAIGVNRADAVKVLTAIGRVLELLLSDLIDTAFPHGLALADEYTLPESDVNFLGLAAALQRGLSLDLRGADLRDADVSRARLRAADLREVRWSRSTIWPDDMRAEIRARSREIEPGVYRVTDDQEPSFEILLAP